MGISIVKPQGVMLMKAQNTRKTFNVCWMGCNTDIISLGLRADFYGIVPANLAGLVT